MKRSLAAFVYVKNIGIFFEFAVLVLGIVYLRRFYADERPSLFSLVLNDPIYLINHILGR